MGATRATGNVTWHLISVVVLVCFGTWFPMGFGFAVVNGPQALIIRWVRQIQCKRLKNSSLDLNSTYLWCDETGDGGDGRPDMLLNNVALNTLWALISSILLCGALFSSFATASIIAKLGLKWTFYFYGALMVAGILMCCISPSVQSYELLILGRFLTGFAVGVTMVATPIYTSEINPSSCRAAVGTIPIIFFVTGMIASGGLSLPGNAHLQL